MSRDSYTRFPVTRRGFFLSCAAALAYTRGVADTPACALTAEQEVGPYYVDYGQLRQDVTEGRPGVPLKLRVALVHASTCAPLDGAAVDIWHCDASGLYSGFTANSPDGGGPGRRPPGGGPWGPGRPGRGPEDGPPPARVTDAARFLRGVQVSDKQGLIEFATLYPGWYSGRAIHIHVKIHLGGSAADGKYAGGHVSHTGQLFFPEEITQDVARLDPYVKRLGVYRTNLSSSPNR